MNVSKEFWEDLKWGESSHTMLLNTYRDQWVAINNKEVVAAGTNLQKVEKEAKKNSYELIRLKGVIQLKTSNGWTKPYPAIIDTGAHTSVIPLSIWKQSTHEKVGKYKMFGISKKEDCFLNVDIGKITCILVDEKANQTEELVC
ncbi:hypothetical protein HY837_04130 [archaeon]|nr:hypothetical protein [archaeon]